MGILALGVYGAAEEFVEHCDKFHSTVPIISVKFGARSQRLPLNSITLGSGSA